MQEIKLVPQIDDFKTMFGGASDLNISPVDVKVQHDIFVSYLYILFAVADSSQLRSYIIGSGTGYQDFSLLLLLFFMAWVHSCCLDIY
jgi:hypothetical protein